MFIGHIYVHRYFDIVDTCLLAHGHLQSTTLTLSCEHVMLKVNCIRSWAHLLMHNSQGVTHPLLVCVEHFGNIYCLASCRQQVVEE